MAKAVKRRSVWSDSGKVQAQTKVQPPARQWSLVLGEAVILALIVAVPLAISPKSNVLTDIKDAVLGLGAAVGLTLWLVAGLAQRRLSWVRTPLIPLALVYLLWAVAGIFYSGYWFVAIGEVGRLAAGVGLFLLTVASIRSLPQVRRIVGAVCVVSVPVGIYAIMQARGDDFLQWSNQAGAERVFSFLGNPTYLGGFALLIMPLLVAIIWSRGRETGSGRATSVVVAALTALSLVLILYSMYLSFTVAAVIGLGFGAIVALVLIVVTGGRRAIRTAIIVVVVAAAVLGPLTPVMYRSMPEQQRERVQQIIHLQDPAAAERQLHWRAAWKLFKKRPIAGEGYGTFRVYALEQMTSEWYSQGVNRSDLMLLPGYAHNEYLQVLADSGAIGGVLFLALLVTFYVTLFRLVRRHPEAEWRRLGLGIAAAATAFLFQNLVGVTFRQSGDVMFFWLWMGVAAAGASTLRSGDREPRRPPVAERRTSGLPALAAGTLSAALVLVLLGWGTITPLAANMRLRVARGLAGAARYREAIAACDATLALCPYSSLAYYIKAYAAGEMGDFEGAMEANREALKYSPGNASAYYNLGVSYKQLRQYDEAEKCFREAIRLMPIKQHYASLAETLADAGRLDEAEEEAHRTVQMDPYDDREPSNARVAALITRIQAQRSGKSLVRPKTEAEIRTALAQHPENALLHGQLAYMLIKQKRFQEAMPEAQRWVELAPGTALAHGAVGACAFNLKDYQSAKAAFTRQVGLDPKNLRAHLNLAFSHVFLHEDQAAVDELNYVIAHGGDSPEGKEAKRILGTYRPQPQPVPLPRPIR